LNYVLIFLQFLQCIIWEQGIKQ